MIFRLMRLETHELEIIRGALGGPYKEASYFSSGLSSHESLQRKVDAELARRGVAPKDESLPSGVRFVLSPAENSGGVIIHTGVSLASGPYVDVCFFGMKPSPVLWGWSSLGAVDRRAKAAVTAKALRDAADELERAVAQDESRGRKDKP